MGWAHGLDNGETQVLGAVAAGVRPAGAAKTIDIAGQFRI